ncbi:MAG: VWA domain-containing protein [Pirellulaceae bacterium]
MYGGRFAFERPEYLLLLLVLLPWIYWVSRQSLAGLGPVRRWLALLLRSLVLLLIVAALAGVQWVWTSQKMTVLYLLDQSDSIPAPKRQLMLQFAIENANAHRRAARQDRAGLIIFGREAAVEFPPLDDDLPPIRTPESYLGKTDATNLEGALKLAKASFPEGASRRIVVLTDGNETLGAAAPVAQSLADEGIGIDIVPIRLDSQSEVLVEKIDIPAQVKQGQMVDAKVVLQRYSQEPDAPATRGVLRVTRRMGNQAELLAEEEVSLDKPLSVFPVPHRVEYASGYTYEAQFIPAEASQDALAQNNQATAFSYARGKGRVLLIEDAGRRGEFQLLVDALRRSEIEVEVRDPAALFSSLIELQAFDSVILAGVPRTSGEAATELTTISDEQIELMVRNTQQFGGGLLMLGGPEAFGAGGWSNTKLEEAMPVDFQIKNSKMEAVGALAMVMHASEIAQGNFWQKMIGKAALDVLGPLDYCGVIEYQGSEKWMWGNRYGMLKVGPNRSVMRSRMTRMTPGDMPDFDPSMRLALAGLTNTPAATKHMIVISDGDPSPASAGVLDGFVKQSIKVSTVAVGAHGPAGHQELQRIANTTGGNYYVVTNPNALPQIFVREARRVARPLVYEPEGGVVPQMLFRHEILAGLPQQLPPVRGFVLTQLKESPLVEVPLRSPMPAEPEYATLRATWTYGLGRTAAFTTDAGQRWAAQWATWPQFDQFFSQLVRWTMRPTQDDGKFQIATQVRDGRVQLVVSALDEEDRFLNFLDLSAAGVGPDLKPFTIRMAQSAPGRYVGDFEASQSGSYLLSVIPGPGRAPLITGVNVPFSDEYRVRQANLGLLTQMASLKASGGQTGMVTEPLESMSLKELLSWDSYREGVPPAISLQDIWPWAVLLGSVLFFTDVLVRRVAIDPGAWLRWLAKRRAARTAVVPDERLDRLRKQKSEVSGELARRAGGIDDGDSDQGRESTRTSSPSDAAAAIQSFDSLDSSAKPTSQPGAAPPAASPGMADAKEDTSYTSRLLQAKRDAQKKNPPTNP